jgi:hypothetical protein
MALGIGPGAELQAPLAIAVLGGLVSATALTLVVIPVAYDVLEELGEGMRAWWGRPAAAPAPAPASAPAVSPGAAMATETRHGHPHAEAPLEAVHPAPARCRRHPPPAGRVRRRRPRGGARGARQRRGPRRGEHPPGLGRGRGWRVVSEPLVDIGVADGDAAYQFGRVAGALRLADGRIVVADEQANHLRYFDAAGRHLRTVGGQAAARASSRR